MAQSSKIEIKELAKFGVLSEELFYSSIAEQYNYIDNKVAKEFYLALMRAVTQGLRKNGIVRLPHMGDLVLVKQKDKMGISGVGRCLLRGKYTLKFYQNLTWKKYFTRLANKDGQSGRLDPREKILNRKL